MKKGVVSVLTLGAALYLSSCSKPSCVPPVIKTVSWYSVNYIPDTSATVLKAKKGTNFAQIAEKFNNISLDKNKVMIIPYKGAETYDYDWQITLNPSGKVYKLTKLRHEDDNPNTTNCVSPVYYSLNDSAQTLAGSPYSMTPTTQPEIKIQYQ